MKKITETEAREWMVQAIENDLCFGVRGDNFIPVLNFENSNVWDDGEMTDEELCGLCAIQVLDETWIDQALTDSKKYGKNTFIITGEYCEYGEDTNEIIIVNHSVYAMIEN
jgi:hypothetical protein